MNETESGIESMICGAAIEIALTAPADYAALSPLRGSEQFCVVTQGSLTRLGLSSDRCSAA